MRSNDILTVRVDLENGEYILSRYDGQQSLVKSINDGEKNSYDKAYVTKRRKEIIGNGYVPTEKEKQIDVGLYDALIEFDKKYETEYAPKYIDITTEQIPYKGLSEKKRDYKIRVSTHKMAEFIQAKMTIDYDLNIFKAAKNLSLRDRFQIFRQAFAQKLNGVQVNVNKPQKTITEPLLGPSQEEAEIKEIIQSIRDNRKQTFKNSEEINTMEDSAEETVEQESFENQPTEKNGFKAEQFTEPEIEEQKIDEKPNAEQIDIEENKEYLSSIKIGTAMQIDSGKYYQSADESGMYGYFEKLQGMKTEISKIVIIDGQNQLIKANKDENLYDLKRKYPEAKFSYHFIIRAEDNSEKVLGWTTDISKAKIIERENAEEQLTSQITEEKADNTKPQQEQKPKKTVSRAKSRQASKKAAREAKKLKNIYQAKQKDTVKPVKTQEQIQAEVRARKQAKAQKNAEAMRLAREQAAEQKRLKEEQQRAEQERIAKEEQAKKDAKFSSRVKRIILGKKDAEGQEEHIVKRFTRKLKDQKDSIRNKIHIPKATKRTIVGAVGTVCVVAALGLGIASLNSNGNSKVEMNQPAIESTYEVSAETKSPEEVQSPDETDYEEAIKQTIRFEENDQKQTGTEEETIQGIEENTEKSEETVEENTEIENEEAIVTDSSKEYLSSVKVGATMNIESGKYFECPDGTGNYGYFENQQNGKKEISIIGITTNKGYFSTTDQNMSLYELKEMYPDAKFSYHFVCRYEDGSTKTLGWLTENSLEQNIDNTRQSSVDEGR